MTRTLTLTLIFSVLSSSLGDATQLKLMPRFKLANEVWVMSIDTGIAAHPIIDSFVERDDSINYEDTHGHGTHIAGLILYGPKLSDKLCPQIRVFSCRYYDLGFFSDYLNSSNKCIEKAIEMNMDYINYSSSGQIFSMTEYRLFKKFKGIAVVAMGNEGYNVSVTNPAYPALYGIGFNITLANGAILPMPALKNVIPVANAYSDGTYVDSSNKHPKAVKELGYELLSTGLNGSLMRMTGTSQATAVHTHKLLKDRCNLINKGVSNGK